jgi:hypothetical protein
MNHYDYYFQNKTESEQETICDSLYKESIENTDLELLDYLIRNFSQQMFYNGIMYNDVELVKMMVLDYGVDFHRRNHLSIYFAVKHNCLEIFVFLMDQNAVLYSENRHTNRLVDEFIEKNNFLSINKIII